MLFLAQKVEHWLITLVFMNLSTSRKTDQQLAINQDRREGTRLEFDMYNTNRNFDLGEKHEFDIQRADGIRNAETKSLICACSNWNCRKRCQKMPVSTGMINNLLGGLFSLGSLL